ncbi:glycosyltransferase [Micromonospora sp. WMMD1082]|uniref:glycosyltransferase n=1 Tax=Micromonospora sp. WMMD1082 TaxID=3016104 RepID=UPI00241616F8|nr:glycosyltransferase [Micromonospora sp. WMMD1082]MDG4792828.1 glycosyltransferase [Micromonospora sp. WMMD1082]
MSISPGNGPQLSVIIPTFNRSDLLRQTLGNLARQRMPTEMFEVIVADDGSSDDTRAVVTEAAKALPVRYHFQPDEGFRAGAARNAGARLATAPILVFLDTGALVGPDFLDCHLAEHDAGDRTAVVGYAYGYDLAETTPGLAAAAAEALPEQVVARFQGVASFADDRQPQLVACDFDLGQLAAPWVLFWTLNCSLRADDFWRLGGFDEDFRGWGLEDLELAYRLFNDGVGFRLARQAWVVHAPHGRDRDAILADCMRNLRRLLVKHPEPPIEIVWRLMQRASPLDLEVSYQFLLSWADRARGIDVADELAREVSRLDPAGRTVVVGAGNRVPPTLPAAILLDFDADLLAEATSATSHVGHHAIGLRTLLEDGAADTVLLTSRLVGLWPRWGRALLTEAHRIGRSVRLTDAFAEQIGDSPPG